MHEYGLAKDLLEAADREVRRLGGGVVSRLRVEIGELAGVSPEAFAAALEVAARDTPFEGAAIEFVHVPGRLRCEACGVQGSRTDLDLRDPSPSGPWVCPRCGYLLVAIEGRSLGIRDLIFESAEASEGA